MSLFRDIPPEVSVHAAEDTHLLILERDEFEAVVKEYPEVALGVCRRLSQRLELAFQNMGHPDEQGSENDGLQRGEDQG